MAVDQTLSNLTTWANLDSTTVGDINEAYMDIMEPARQHAKGAEKTDKTVERAATGAEKVGEFFGRWGEMAGQAISWVTTLYTSIDGEAYQHYMNDRAADILNEAKRHKLQSQSGKPASEVPASPPNKQ